MLKLATLGVAMTLLVAVPKRPYDESANAWAEIARMLQCARDEGKPVLLMFGANWCEWCQALDRKLVADKDLATLVDAVFLRLNIDIGSFDRNLDVAAEYGLKNLDDTGVPMLVVLRPDGVVDAVKNSEDFVVGSRYANDRIRSFIHALGHPAAG
jgi:thioredoxin 1